MIKNITVVGAGTMGNGIAHVFAQYGFHVTLVGISEDNVNKAIATITQNLDRQVNKGHLSDDDKTQTLSRISTSLQIAVGVANADLVVEAALEDTALKLDIFKQIAAAAPATAILASNTSSISITQIAAVTNRPQQVIGMHFMNPVPVMKLVEVINGYATSQETTNTIVSLSQQLNKIPAVVNDYPGFIANRLLMPMINEAIYSLHENVASVEAIDIIMKLGMAHPMGPLQLADFIGLDVCLNIMKVLHSGFGNAKYAPCPLLINMVTAGKLGVKSGEGFYTYAKGSKEMVVSSRFRA